MFCGSSRRGNQPSVHVCCIGLNPTAASARTIEIVIKRRHQNGRWPLNLLHCERIPLEMETAVGSASRWNTLRALRVLRWSVHLVLAACAFDVSRRKPRAAAGHRSGRNTDHLRHLRTVTVQMQWLRRGPVIPIQAAKKAAPSKKVVQQPTLVKQANGVKGPKFKRC
jgi:hypothetical protein